MAANAASFKDFRKYITLSDFKIVEELGRGNFATVHKVIDNNTGVAYALKKIDLVSDCNLKQIKDEIKSLKNLSNENIVKIFGADIDLNGESHDEPYVVKGSKIVYANRRAIHPNYILVLMENCETSAKLSHNIQHYRSNNQRRIEVIKQVINASLYLKRNGINYQRLNVNNIVIDKNGVIKLNDYGFAPENLKIRNNNLEQQNFESNSEAVEYQNVAPEKVKSCMLRKRIKPDELEKINVYDLGIIWLYLCIDAMSPDFAYYLSNFKKGNYAIAEENISGKEAVLLSMILIAERSKRLTIDAVYEEVIRNDFSRCEMLYKQCTQIDFEMTKKAYASEYEQNNCKNNDLTDETFGESKFGITIHDEMTFTNENYRNRLSKLEIENERKEKLIQQMTKDKLDMIRSNAKLESEKKYFESKIQLTKADLNELKVKCDKKESVINLMVNEEVTFAQDICTLAGENESLTKINEDLAKREQEIKHDYTNVESKISVMRTKELENMVNNAVLVTEEDYLISRNEAIKQETEELDDICRSREDKYTKMNKNYTSLVMSTQSLKSSRTQLVAAYDEEKQTLAEHRKNARLEKIQLTKKHRKIREETRERGFKAGEMKGTIDTEETAYKQGYQRGKANAPFIRFTMFKHS